MSVHSLTYSLPEACHLAPSHVVWLMSLPAPLSLLCDVSKDKRRETQATSDSADRGESFKEIGRSPAAGPGQREEEI